MAETTVNDSIPECIDTNAGGERVFSTPEDVARFAVKTSGQVAALLAVIGQSASENRFIEDALEAVQDMAWQVQQATSLLAMQIERTTMEGA